MIYLGKIIRLDLLVVLDEMVIDGNIFSNYFFDFLMIGWGFNLFLVNFFFFGLKFWF